MKRLDTSTLERLVPDYIDPTGVTGWASLQLHLERYRFAARHIRAGRVLDIACGVGYGTRLIAESCAETVAVVGVDISPEAIEYAASRYRHERIEYHTGDAMMFHDPQGFDAIVSLETIEHVPSPEAFLRNILRSLRAGGFLIASVPVTPTVDANPHHISDFTKSSFERLLERHGLQGVDYLLQVQPFNPLPVLRRDQRRLSDLRRNVLAYYMRRPDKLARRIASVIKVGFNNRYLTIAAQKLSKP